MAVGGESHRPSSTPKAQSDQFALGLTSGDVASQRCTIRKSGARECRVVRGVTGLLHYRGESLGRLIRIRPYVCEVNRRGIARAKEHMQESEGKHVNCVVLKETVSLLTTPQKRSSQMQTLQ